MSTPTGMMTLWFARTTSSNALRKNDVNWRVAQYAACLALEVAGMVLILWDGLPIYRHLMTLEQVSTTADIAIMWTAVTAIQFSYWYMLRHDAPFRFPRQVFLAHILLFVSRLGFVFASSLFALVVFRYSDALVFQPSRVLLFIAVLFSVFCFSRYLETIGNLMLKDRQKNAEPLHLR